MLQKDIELVTYFIRRIQEQKQFLRTPSLTFSMPLAADESQKKHYLVCYGQLAETMIASADVSPDFYYEKERSSFIFETSIVKRRNRSCTNLDQLPQKIRKRTV